MMKREIQSSGRFSFAGSKLRAVTSLGLLLVLLFFFQNCQQSFLLEESSRPDSGESQGGSSLTGGPQSSDQVSPPLPQLNVPSQFDWSEVPSFKQTPPEQSIVVAPELSASEAAQHSPIIVRLRNIENTPLEKSFVSFGHLFEQGVLPQGAHLIALSGRANVRVQIDPKNFHPDGSIKFGILTLLQPEIPAGQFVDVALAQIKDPISVATLNSSLLELSGINLEFTFRELDGSTTKQVVDFNSALKNELQKSKPDFWLKGPSALQLRTQVLVRSSLRVVLDLTRYSDGNLVADFLVANDIAMGPAGGTLEYDLVIRGIPGRAEKVYRSLKHFQYSQFRANLDTRPKLAHVQIDPRSFIKTRVVPPFNVALGTDLTKVNKYQSDRLTDVNWGTPFHPNGVATFMPGTGNRPDIGIVTESQATWFVTQDHRARQYAIGQAEAAAGIPWHFWDQANNQWLNLEKYPSLWVDGRGKAPPTGLSQQIDNTNIWKPEAAHHPSLSFIPYIMTGERFYLDQLLAQATYSILITWPYPRKDGLGLVNNGSQVRGAAWRLRDIFQAYIMSPDSSWSRSYFSKILDNNLQFQNSMLTEWTVEQGETHGYLPGAYGTSRSMAPWQQDHYIVTMISIARSGNPLAKNFLDWAQNFHLGRFMSETKGFNPRDGVAYNLIVQDPAFNFYKTWREVGEATVALNQSNLNGWNASNGNYGRLGLMTLALYYSYNNNNLARQAYYYLRSLNPPHTAESSQRIENRVSMEPPPLM